MDERRAPSRSRRSSASSGSRARAARLARRADRHRRARQAVIETMPHIAQAIVCASPDIADQDAFERKILTIRKQTLNRVTRRPSATCCRRCATSTCRPSRPARWSTRGCCSPQIGSFYEDLRNPLTVSALALVHQRFSTNTFPSWRLAHPYRFLCHNGEINTVRGNVNWIHARRQAMSSALMGADLGKMTPLILPGQSDTACIDNALELLVVAGGYSLAHAMMMLIPEAWSDPLMDPERRAFYEYHAALMEPWDGPAAIAFTDGRQIGATLDRNGLRPARYIITDDDHVILASEAGVLPVPEERITRKWRLQPGKMLLIDLEEGRIIGDDEIKQKLAAEHPYEAWLKATQFKLSELPEPAEPRSRRAPTIPRRGSRCSRPSATPRRTSASSSSRWARRRRPDRLDGHRHADRRVLEQAEGALQLLQAEFRAGHQPADRPDPRGTGDVADLDDRAAAEPARPRGRHASPARSVAADPDRQRSRQDPQYRAAGRGAVQDRHARHHLAGGRRRGGHRAGARPDLPRGDRGGARRPQHPDPVRPRGVARAGADPGAARDLGGASSPDPRGAAHPHRHRRRDRRRASGARFLRARRLWRRGDQPLSRLRDLEQIRSETGMALSAYDVQKNY
jgi:glutamate synthase domain-containing protein 1